MEGALEFLNACGFREITLDNELFLIWSKENIEPDYDLPTLLEALKNAEQIHLELDRNIKVLLPSQAKRVALPDDFYRISPEEIKREQQLRTEAIENSQILKTKAMREREEQRTLRMYKYALIRVKFPNGLYIQVLLCTKLFNFNNCFLSHWDNRAHLTFTKSCRMFSILFSLVYTMNLRNLIWWLQTVNFRKKILIRLYMIYGK